jgi:hypothetical protein
MMDFSPVFFAWAFPMDRCKRDLSARQRSNDCDLAGAARRRRGLQRSRVWERGSSKNRGGR